MEQSLLSRSNEKPKFFTFAEYIIPSNKEIYSQIRKLAKFNNKILFEIAANSAFYLLNKRTLNKTFKKDDLVYVLDSLSDALGRVKEILPSGSNYSITLMDRTTISCHYSDIVSALATKSNSDVTLIDPFQLIDWKEQTPPDHLFPKFKLFLDNLKEGHQTPFPTITCMEDNENHLDIQPFEV